MTYELQTKPAPPKLAEAFGGSVAELHELSYGAMSDAMRLGGDRGRASDGLLAQSLHVDGQPVGLDALLSLPGRYSRAVRDALSACVVMHGLGPDEDDDAADDDRPAAAGAINHTERARHPKQ